MNKFMVWVDVCFFVIKMWEDYLSKYYVLKNFNFWYFFGFLVLLVLVNQIFIGIWLIMSFMLLVEEVFVFVEYIMCDVDYGWIICYMYFIGVLVFFIVVYLYMFCGLFYGFYQKLCELVWIFGMLIYLVLMVEVFMGYLLFWGQMFYWGVQVIIFLFGVILVVGEDLVQWICGDFLIFGIILNCFFVLYVIVLLIVLFGLVVLYILVLYEVGLNNLDGVDIKKKKDENGVLLDGIVFYLYYIVKDIVGVVVFLFIFCIVIFFFLEMGGYFFEKFNFEMVNQFKIFEYIVLVWYFILFYVIFCVVLDKLMGVVVMGVVIVVLFVLLWLDCSLVCLICYKGWLSKLWLVIFVVFFVIFGYYGVQVLSLLGIILLCVCIVLYFVFFILMLFYIWMEKIKLVLERVIG